MEDIWRQVSRIISSSERWNWLAFVLLLVGLGVVAFLVSPRQRDIHFVERSSEAEPFCEQPMATAATGPDQFRAYVTTDFVGHDLCGRLSHMPVLGGRYRSVRAEWSLSDEVLSRLIFEGYFDLLQLRPEEAQEPDGPFSRYYHRISYYPPYKVFLIARDAAPVLTAEYLGSRRIGLLEDPTSRSGYRVPMQVFRDLGLDRQQLQLSFYDSHNELRLALERGEVDVIGSYWDPPQKAGFPDWHPLEIGGVKEGLNWFLANDVFDNTQERCAVIEALEHFEVGSGDPYFAKLSFTADAKKGCDAH